MTADLSGLPLSVIPRHLAIIMDGNGRWAASQGRGRLAGHSAGAESVRVIVEACRRLDIPALTLYAFSEENWGRPKSEINALMALLKRFLYRERALLRRQNIRLRAIGDLGKLPSATRAALEQTAEATASCDGMILTLALSYGGRQEITHACRTLSAQVLAGEIKPDDITPEIFESYLYTSPWLPDPDFLIRTSGEIRISNFLLWQLAYCELYFTSTPWPAFREAELMEALVSFAGRQRRFGKLE
ncbi:MAG: isoprenyl transferase [Desulfarculales bacterium]|jgi:undecaprenyl diphosphate synthase|nr:isoprenyl transferase [Desulfarculales bacterium]